jgi:hypothetical protein
MISWMSFNSTSSSIKYNINIKYKVLLIKDIVIVLLIYKLINITIRGKL